MACRFLIEHVLEDEIGLKRRNTWPKNRRENRGIGEFEIHSRPAARRRPGKDVWIRRGMLAVLVVVAVFSAVQAAGIITRSVRTRQLNDALSERRAQLSATPEPLEAEAAAPAATPEPETAPEPSAKPGPVVRNTVYHRVGGPALKHMEELYNENRDLIGWIEIPGVLDLPVMYRNNSYYLNRDFYKKKNASGTLFLDVNHRFAEDTQNLLLHGHNMKDGTMFGRLTQYLHNMDYFKRNAFVYYDTLWEADTYVMFSVMQVSLDAKDERFFNYFTHPTFETDEDFEHYIRQAQLRSIYAIPMNVRPDDALLTLSTCIDEDRLVILCRRLREGERKSQVQQNLNLTVRQ